MDAGTLITVAMAGVVIALVLGYSIWAGAMAIADSMRAGMKEALAIEAVKQAANKYMESLRLDMAAVASHQERQESEHLRMVGMLINQLRLVPVYEMGVIKGFRRAKKDEVFNTAVPNWHDTEKVIES